MAASRTDFCMWPLWPEVLTVWLKCSHFRSVSCSRSRCLNEQNWTCIFKTHFTFLEASPRTYCLVQSNLHWSTKSQIQVLVKKDPERCILVKTVSCVFDIDSSHCIWCSRDSCRQIIFCSATPTAYSETPVFNSAKKVKYWVHSYHC